MAELFLFTAFCLILGIGAGIQDFIERKRNARFRRNVQRSRRLQASRRSQERLHPLFYEQKGNVYGYSLRKFA